MSDVFSHSSGLVLRLRLVLAVLWPCFLLGSAQAQTFRDLGVDAMRHGDFTKAVIEYEKSLETAQKVLKEEDLELVICHAELGEAYRGACRWDEAIEQLNYAWKRVRYDAEQKGRWLNEEGELAVRFGEFLGRTYQAARRYGDAEMVFSSMIADGERSKRDESELLQPCGLLADTLLLLKRNGEADIYVQKAVTIAERRHANNTGVQAAVFSGLASIYVEHDLYAKAQPLALRALELTSKLPEPDLATLATYQSSLGVILANRGEYEFAEKMLDGAQAFFSEKMTPDSEKFMPIQRGYSVIALKRGQLKEALAFAREALRLCKLHYTDDNPELARCLGQIAKCYAAMDDKVHATEALNLALMISGKTLGQDHPLTEELRDLRDQTKPAAKSTAKAPER